MTTAPQSPAAAPSPPLPSHGCIPCRAQHHPHPCSSRTESTLTPHRLSVPSPVPGAEPPCPFAPCATAPPAAAAIANACAMLSLCLPPCLRKANACQFLLLFTIGASSCFLHPCLPSSLRPSTCPVLAWPICCNTRDAAPVCDCPLPACGTCCSNAPLPHTAFCSMRPQHRPSPTYLPTYLPRMRVLLLIA